MTQPPVFGRDRVCPRCKGTGKRKDDPEGICRVCGGAGTVR